MVVEPDLADFEAKLQSDLAAMDPHVKVKVDADAAGLAAKVQAAADASGTSVRVGVDPDTADLAAKVQAAADASKTTVDVPVEPDAAGFDAKLQAVVDEEKATAEVPLGITPGAAAKLDAEVKAAAAAAGGDATAHIHVDIGGSDAAQWLASASTAFGDFTTSAQNARSAADSFTLAADAAAAATARMSSGAGGSVRNTTLFGTALGVAQKHVSLFGGALSNVGLPAIIGAASGIHMAIEAVVEFAGVLIPASIALGAFGLAAVPAVQGIVKQMTNLNTVATATSQSVYPLSGAFQQVAAAVKPQVYQLFGDALTVMNQRTGVFGKLATAAGTALDQLGARLTTALTSGHGFSGMLASAAPDLTLFGNLIGNIGGILGNFLKVLPGYAPILFGFADGITHVGEAVTGSGIVQGFLKAGLAAHGYLLYTGLLATGATKLLTGFGKFPGILSAASDALLNGAAKVESFGAAGEKASTGMLSMASGLEKMQGWNWGWITLGAAAVAVLAYKFFTAKDAADQFISSMNTSLAAAPIAQAAKLLNSDLAISQERLAGAAQGMTKFSGASLALGHALAPIAPGLSWMNKANDWLNNLAGDVIGSIPGVNKLTNSFFGLGTATTSTGNNAALAVHDYEAYRSEVNTLITQGVTFKERLGQLAVSFGGTASAMGILTAAGITTQQMLSKSSGTWAQILVQIQGTLNAYRAMGQQSGVLGADMNAMTIAGSSQAAAMTQLNTAWDTTIGIVSGGQGAFITFQQDMLSVNKAVQQAGGTSRTVSSTFAGAAKAAKTAGGSMNGLNAASLQLRSTWQTAYAGGAKMIDALRMMISVSPQASKSTGDLTQAVKDVVAQLSQEGDTSKATRAELVSLAQEVDPSIKNFTDLTTWLGNTKNAGQDLNRRLADMGVNLQNLAKDAASVSGTLQQDIVRQFDLSKMAANGTTTAVNNLATAFGHQKSAATQLQSAQSLYDKLTKQDNESSSTAIALVDSLTGNVYKLKGGILQLPASHATKITTPGVTQAISDTQRLLAEINNLHSKTIDIRVITQASTQGAGGTGGYGHGQLTAGYATGGVLPGYAPGRDTLNAKLSPGEGILVPEAVRGLGGAPAINAINAAYGGARVRNARGDGTSRLRHFAGGGIMSTVQALGMDTFNINVSVPQSRLGNWGGWGGWSPRQDAGNRLSVAEGAVAAALTPAALKVMQHTGETLVRAFSDGSLKTLAQVKTEAATAIAAIRKYYTGEARHDLVSSIQKQTAALGVLAAKSQKIATEISGMKSFASSVSSNLASSSGLSSMTAPKAGETATQIGQGIKTQLNLDLKQLHNFFGIIGQAKKAGLDKTFIEQAIALGPVDGYTYLKAALSGGKSLIATINKDEAGIAAQDKLIGRRAADIQYGQSISKGFLSGLDKEKSKLDKEMRRLGDEIAKELAKALDVPVSKIPAAVRHAGTHHHHDTHPAPHHSGKPPLKGHKPANSDIKITINYNGKKPSAEDQAAAMRKLASAIGGVG